MSMDAGGLAQMTYNNHNAFGGGLGMPGTGFGSRGKLGNMKRLNVPPPSSISTIDENQPAPRTSRSHLLAGLRTAPKSPGFPASAPPTQQQHPIPAENHYAQKKQFNHHQAMPKTAAGAGFPGSFQGQLHPQQMPQQQVQPQQQPQQHGQFNMNAGINHVYSPHDILAPPAIQIGDDLDASEMDPYLYEELMRTNQYLAQQQARLQQQLINVTAAAQQFQNMNLGQGQDAYAQQMGMAGLYNQQLQQGIQPIIQPVPGQPGMFAVYNPMTGQTALAYDQSCVQQQGIMEQQNTFGSNELSRSPPPATPTSFRARTSPPPRSASPLAPASHWRSSSPPKSSPSPPQEKLNPLPPPSANAFRPSHRKGNLSLASGSVDIQMDGSKVASSFKSTVLPPTPMTGTFGPGQAREGEHPIRQPKGPPSLEELVAKPTAKFEGSKNFASRQRRRAVNNLVRAGIERRGARSVGSADSGSPSPTSEHGITFSISSDNDDDVSVRSGSASLDGKPSIGAPRSPMISPIGSERKELIKERSRQGSPELQYTAASVSGDEDGTIGGKLMEVKRRSLIY